MSARMSIHLVNGIEGDPAVLVGFPNHGHGILFDAGSLEKLAVKDLLKIRAICVSHAHVDHFIGFDRIIRVNIPHFRTIEVVGPPGIASQVRSKLLGYTWNLLEPGQITYRVHEVQADGRLETTILSSDDCFSLGKPEVKAPLNGGSGAIVPLLDFDVVVSAIILDHGTPVCGYSITLPPSFAVSIDAVEKLKVATGPWIGELQKMAIADKIIGKIELPNGELREANELAKAILTKIRGQQISYLTDIVFSKENLARINSQFYGSDTLICETNFRHEHRDRATKKKHLTTKQAALFAASLGCSQLMIFHVSNIYANEHQVSVDEAAEFYARFSQATADQLRAEIQLEFG
jgi:ribonuclease Z